MLTKTEIKKKFNLTKKQFDLFFTKPDSTETHPISRNQINYFYEATIEQIISTPEFLASLETQKQKREKTEKNKQKKIEEIWAKYQPFNSNDLLMALWSMNRELKRRRDKGLETTSFYSLKDQTIKQLLNSRVIFAEGHYSVDNNFYLTTFRTGDKKYCFHSPGMLGPRLAVGPAFIAAKTREDTELDFKSAVWTIKSFFKLGYKKNKNKKLLKAI